MENKILDNFHLFDTENMAKTPFYVLNGMKKVYKRYSTFYDPKPLWIGPIALELRLYDVSGVALV